MLQCNLYTVFFGVHFGTFGCTLHYFYTLSVEDAVTSPEFRLHVHLRIDVEILLKPKAAEQKC